MPLLTLLSGSGTTPAPGVDTGIFPDSEALEIGRGGGYRNTLINESYVAMVLPLAELSTLSQAEDITENHHNGTFVGSGFTRGVPMAVPEGLLGLTFSGADYVQVLDDSAEGFYPFNLSGAGGSVDVAFLIKTSTNDGTLRAIVQKQQTNSSGNGWHVALQSGAIRFFLRGSGVTIFNFARGAVADGLEHLVHCCYQPEIGEARIFIDGVQSGATVTGVTTEPELTAANLRVGAFNDGAGMFIGTLAMVMMGREGNPALSANLQATRAWTNIITDVLVNDIRVRYGISGSSVIDHVGQPGMLTCRLNNSQINNAGQLGTYSPRHANALPGFEIGIPIRFSSVYDGVTYYKFRGRISSITPLPNVHGERSTLLACVGWLDVASNTPMPAVETPVDQRSDELIKMVIDQAAGRSPAAVDISIGSSTFPFAFDRGASGNDSLLTEGARVTSSEQGYWYEKGDTVQGGTVRWEGRGDRQITSALAATFTDTMHGLHVEYGLEHLVNVVRVVFTPRRVDPTNETVLYASNVSQSGLSIAPGETVNFKGSYRNPDEEAVNVGGLDMQIPVAGTDYGFWGNSDGTGTNLVADLEVFSDGGKWLGASSFELDVTNNGSQVGFLRIGSASEIGFQLRGRGIYHYAPVTVERRINASIRRHGPRPVQIDLAYQSSRVEAEAIADFLLSSLGMERPIAKTITIIGNRSDELLTQALAREPGDKIGIVESMTGISTTDPDFPLSVGYFIHQVDLGYRWMGAGALVTVTWTLAPSVPTGVWVWDESVWDSSTTWGF